MPSDAVFSEGGMPDLHGDDVIVVGTVQHLDHVLQVHAHAQVAVTSVVLKPVGAQLQGDQGDVAGIHGLQTRLFLF